MRSRRELYNIQTLSICIARNADAQNRNVAPILLNYNTMPKGYMYMLACNDGSYYIGSTKYLAICFMRHALGEGAKYTQTRLPVKLVYVEAYDSINEAFYREKQVQGWSRQKKEVLIAEMQAELNALAKYTNETYYSNK